jgi:heme-degrading monooxygenase HmoA
MILEVAILNVRAGAGDAFEAAFREASGIIASMPGYHSHEVRRCVEAPGRYLLLVHWQRLEDHTIGFRQSAGYQRWRAAAPFLRSLPDGGALRGIHSVKGRVQAPTRPRP